MLGPLWSLPLEVQMYVLLPFAYFVIRKRVFRSIGLLILAVALALVIPGITARLEVFSYAPCFAAGIVAWDLSRVLPKKLPPWMWPFVVGLVIVLFGPLDDISLPAKITRAWLVSGLLGLTIPLCREHAVPWLRGACHVIAKYSYGIYLSHVIVFWLVIDVMRNQTGWLRIATLILLSAGAPVAMYHCLEEPLIRFGARVAARTNRQRPASVAATAW
jgi:peptidoglycan/LPS O-acetylase OafA/YrhL